MAGWGGGEGVSGAVEGEDWDWGRRGRGRGRVGGVLAGGGVMNRKRG